MSKNDPTADRLLIAEKTTLVDAANTWKQCRSLAVDTEFERTRTFYARLALVQISDGESVWLVDPLAIDDLAPLWRILADPGIEKAFHSASEDIALIEHVTGSAPEPLFDTQIAAALCGMGQSLSYRDLAAEVCGVELAKSQTRSNWMKRPLTEAQLRYAANDVIHLLPIKAHLDEELVRLGRTAWCQEDCERLVRDASAGDDVQRLYRDFKWAWKLDPPGRGVLMALLRWREERARAKDLPRRHVLEDHPILELARQRPTERQAIGEITGIQSKRGAAVIAELGRIVADASARNDSEQPAPPPAPLDRAMRGVLKGFKSMVREQAESLGLEPNLLAAKRDLVEIARDGTLPERLTGWRRAVIGDHLRKRREELIDAVSEDGW